MDDPPKTSRREPPGGGARTDPTWLVRILLYGQPATRRRAVARLVQTADIDTWQLLAGTVRSDQPWLLRARSLEALGLVAGAVGRETAEHVLRLLVEGIPEGAGAARDAHQKLIISAAGPQRGR